MSKAQFIKENLKAGEHYAGIVLGQEGKPDYHLVLLAAKPEKLLNWKNAIAWAKKAGGELPTRREQRLLWVNQQAQFDSTWYWSGEQTANFPDYAWYQGFNGGNQGLGHGSNEGRARAVRRILIIE